MWDLASKRVAAHIEPDSRRVFIRTHAFFRVASIPNSLHTFCQMAWERLKIHTNIGVGGAEPVRFCPAPHSLCLAHRRVIIAVPSHCGTRVVLYRKCHTSCYVSQLHSRRVNQPARRAGVRTKLHTRPVATGVFFLTRFFHNFLKNDAQDLKKWSRKTRPAFLYNL